MASRKGNIIAASRDRNASVSSQASLDEYLKRKRDEKGEEENRDGDEVLKKTKKTEDSSGGIIGMNKMMEELKGIRREQKIQGEESRKERELIREELMKVRTDLEEREARWRREREELRKEIDWLKEKVIRMESGGVEGREEREERMKEEKRGKEVEVKVKELERWRETEERERRRNVVVKGLEVKEGGIKEAVEELWKKLGIKRLIAELNKEQEAFIASKQAGEKGEAVAPWVGAPNEDALREECLSLSTDRRNFVRAPPPGVEFTWDFEAVQPMAQATLALDPNLEAMRFELVPKVISEENFWRNYFYRVSLLRQGYELNAMASQQQEESNPNQTLASTDSIDHTQVQMTTGQTTTTGATTASSNSALADSPGHEFVSDTMRVSDTDLEEVREGMKKLGMQPPKEEDWERELEAELKDYEVVTGSNNGGGSGDQERSVATATKDITVNDNDWEKQIDELLANEDDEDLK